MRQRIHQLMSSWLSQTHEDLESVHGAQEEAAPNQAGALQHLVSVPLRIALAQAVCQRVDVEVVWVHDGRFGKVLRRRVLLSYAAVEDDHIVVAPDLSAAAQYGDGGEDRGGLGADVSCTHASCEDLHLGYGVFAHRDSRAPRFSQGVQDQEVSNGGRDPDTGSPCLRILPGFGEPVPRFECTDYWRTAL